jgi:hypothetical protein
MKKTLFIAIILCVFASPAWSLYINNAGYIDVGNLDTYLAAGTKADVGSSGDANELYWINTTLFGGDTSSYYTMAEFDKINTEGGAGWFQAYSSPDPDALAYYTFARHLVTTGGETLYPDYFLIKTGNLNDPTDYRWFLFENNEMLDWAVINLHDQGYSLLELGQLSHIDGVGGTAPVPEPTTLMLLASGLFGLAGFRKKIKN